MTTLTKEELEDVRRVYIEKLLNGGTILNGVIDKLQLMIEEHHDCVASIGSAIFCSLCGKDLR